jgi:hypothetical protein
MKTMMSNEPFHDHRRKKHCPDGSCCSKPKSTPTDKEMLDWMEKYDCEIKLNVKAGNKWVSVAFEKGTGNIFGVGMTIRSAIRSAMKEQKHGK